jgi:hypothetical protein
MRKCVKPTLVLIALFVGATAVAADSKREQLGETYKEIYNCGSTLGFEHLDAAKNIAASRLFEADYKAINGEHNWFPEEQVHRRELDAIMRRRSYRLEPATCIARMASFYSVYGYKKDREARQGEKPTVTQLPLAPRPAEAVLGNRTIMAYFHALGNLDVHARACAETAPVIAGKYRRLVFEAMVELVGREDRAKAGIDAGNQAADRAGRMAAMSESECHQKLPKLHDEARKARHNLNG